MEKVVHVFKSIREAEEFDRDYYQSLTPKQRVDILLELVRDSGEAAGRFERVCRIINRKRDL